MKGPLPAPLVQPDEALLGQIFAWLATQEQPIYLVGGSLRQLLLELPVKDYDFVVPRQAIKLAYRLAKNFALPCFPLDKERDMARVVLPEVVLDFAACGEDLEADLLQRDLSINAIACPVTAELLSADVQALASRLIDPCAGLADLRVGLVRGVSRANFVSDPLRLLRVYRFAARLRFVIDSETESWVRELAALLPQVAAERILQELEQILLGDAAGWIERMQQQGLLPFLPGRLDTAQLRCFEQMSSTHSPEMNVYLYEHLTAQRSRIVVFKLGLLLLSTALSGDQSSGQSSQQADKKLLACLSSLSLSRRELESLALWQRQLPALRELLEQDQDPIGQRFHLLRQAGRDIYALVGFGRIACQLGRWQDPHGRLDQLLADWQDPASPVAHPPALIDGHGLMQALSLKPGPLIGQLLLAIQEAQARQLVRTLDEALAFAAERAKGLEL